MPLTEKARIEMTIHDCGRVAWVVRVAERIVTTGFVANDSDGSLSLEAAIAWATANVRGLGFERLVYRTHSVTPRGPSDRVAPSDAAKFGVMLEQLKRGGTVDVKNVHASSPDPEVDEVLKSTYGAALLAHPRPPGTMTPPTVLTALLTAQYARALIEAGALWFGDADRDPRKLDEATFESMLDELSAKGIVELHEVRCVRRGEILEEVREAYRSAYRFTHKRAETLGSEPPMYARVTVAQASRLCQQGARWAGDPDRDPAVRVSSGP